MSEQQFTGGPETNPSVLPTETSAEIKKIFTRVLVNKGRDGLNQELALILNDILTGSQTEVPPQQQAPVVESPPTAEPEPTTSEEPVTTTVTGLPSNAFILPEVPRYMARAGEYLPFRIRRTDPEYVWLNTHEQSGAMQFEPGVSMALTPMIEDATSLFIGTEPTVHDLLEDPITLLNMLTMRTCHRQDVVEEDAANIIHNLLLNKGHDPENEKVKAVAESHFEAAVAKINAYDSKLVLTTEPHDPTSTAFATMYSSTETDTPTEQFITIERSGPEGEERNRPVYDIEPSHRDGTLNAGRIILQGEIALVGVPRPPAPHLFLPGVKKQMLKIETYAALVQEGDDDYPEVLELIELAHEKSQLYEPELVTAAPEQPARPLTRQQARTARGERRHIGRPEKPSQSSKDKQNEDKAKSAVKPGSNSSQPEEPEIVEDPLEEMFGEDSKNTFVLEMLDRSGKRIARGK